MKDTTIKIDAKRRELLKEAAFNIQYEIRETITMTDVVRYLIDHHLKESVMAMKCTKNHGISG